MLVGKISACWWVRYHAGQDFILVGKISFLARYHAGQDTARYHAGQDIMLLKMSFWARYHSGQDIMLGKISFC